jgi:LPXTG-motif cell wall-anchored protein
VQQSSGAEEDDQMREAQAYNSSIYVMVGMPYLMLGAFGFVVYRKFKQYNAGPTPGDGSPI